MRDFIATYRLQLGPDLRFADVASRAGYLERLGVSHVYLSPIASSTPGSSHGYDVTDPRRISAELGGEEGLKKMADELAARGLGIVIDTVPNHMAASGHNPYWQDVLTHGLHSLYARWFDIDWEGARPILLPELGDELEKVLERGELNVAPLDGRLHLAYYDKRLPLDPRSLPRLLEAAGASELSALVAPLSELPAPLDLSGGADVTRAARAERYLGALADRVRADESGVIDSLRRLTASDIAEILDCQAYRPILWRKANRRGSYRRFFDINQLVALDLREGSALSAVLELPRRLSSDGSIDGVRVDHIDGLSDPARYLAALRDAVGSDRRIWVEKILEPAERIRSSWPVDGTTGYDFIALSEPLFVDGEGAAIIERYFRERTGETRSFDEIAASAKKRALLALFGADLGRLAAKMGESGLPRRALIRSLVEIIAALHVYRTYVTPGGDPGEEDLAIFSEAMRTARSRKPRLERTISAIERFLLSDAGRPALVLLQQITGPVMAKGVEDTAFFRFFPLSSLCEVGCSPSLASGDAIERFHAGVAARAERWPGTMNAISTHDTKRSSDARARISALSEAPGEWISFVERWRERHAPLRPKEVTFRSEYALYQAIFAIWEGAAEQVAGRVRRLCEKTLRESKDESSWLFPNARREKALLGYAESILASARESGFGADLDGPVLSLNRTASSSSLARVALQMLSPGLPDVYMGDEAPRLSLVDPDNRRPVDFLALEREAAAPANEQSKSRLVRSLLRLRRERLALFAKGSYEPLLVHGAASRHLIAFRRRHEEDSAVIVVKRFSLIAERDGIDLSSGAVTSGVEGPLLSYFEDMPVDCRGGVIPLGRHLAKLPVAVFLSPLARENPPL